MHKVTLGITIQYLKLVGSSTRFAKKNPLDLDGFDAFYYHRISRVVVFCYLDKETKPLPLEMKERAEKISGGIWPAQYGFHYDSDSSAHEEGEGYVHDENGNYDREGGEEDVGTIPTETSGSDTVRKLVL